MSRDVALTERVEQVERMVVLLAEALGVDLDRLLLADCDCDEPVTWEQLEACGRDPETGQPVEGCQR